MLDGFKKFILRGNVVDMAVGIVIGAAFGGVVTSLVKSFIEPLIALTVGKPDFIAVGTTISGAHGPVQVPWGAFLTAVINFLLIAAAIYFFVVVPGECADRPDASGREAGGSNHQAMSRVHERNSYSGEALLALHATRHGTRRLDAAQSHDFEYRQTPDLEVWRFSLRI